MTDETPETAIKTEEPAQPEAQTQLMPIIAELKNRVALKYGEAGFEIEVSSNELSMKDLAGLALGLKNELYTDKTTKEKNNPIIS